MSVYRTTPANMSGDDFQRLGYYLVDTIAAFIDTMGERPVTSGETSGQVLRRLNADPLPETGMAPDVILKKAADLLFNHSLLNGHPKFFGYITSSGTLIGALADLLAAAVNPNVGADKLSPAATAIERQTINWLADFIGLSGYGGILVSGGNMANITAVVAAHHNRKPQCPGENTGRMLVYCSTSTHAWIEKASMLWGTGAEGIRWIESDQHNRMRIDLLEAAITEDKRSGYCPFLVIGNAGDVSTGAVDDLKAIGVICHQYQLWFHIDGAYGIPAAVLPELKALFTGMELAQSLALDPHKWLYSPLEVGCLLVKDSNVLRNSFSSHPAYYNFENEEAQSHNYYEYGFQNSRGFRALKVWMGLQQIGRAGYINMMREDIALARYFFQLADEHPELEAVTHNLSIATLRYVPAQAPPSPDEKETYLNQLNEALLNALQQEGKLFLSNAVIQGKYCLRACIVNFRTTRKDVEESIEIIVATGKCLV